MGAYPAGGSMRDVVEAMRDLGVRDEDTIPYVRNIEPILGQIGPIFSAPAIYLEPQGSPEEKIGERAGKKVFRATHKIKIYCVLHIADPDDSKAVLSSGHEVGIVEFADDVIDFYADNDLSLAGIDPGDMPEIQAPENAYGLWTREDKNIWLRVAVLDYQAVIRPYVR